MTHEHSKLGGLIAGRAKRHNRVVSENKLKDALADPHLASNIGLPPLPLC